MNKLRKWRIKYGIKGKITISRFYLRSESRYRLCIYKLLIYKLLVYLNENLINNNLKNLINKNNYNIWLNTINIIIIINNNIKKKGPLKKGKKFRKQVISLQYLTLEIFNLNYLNIIDNNKEILNINYIFKINNVVNLLLWIHNVKINLDLLKGKLFEIFNLINMHQENCKNIKYYYNNELFHNNLSRIFNNIIYLLLNYKFII